MSSSLLTAIQRQLRSRVRSFAYWRSAIPPVLLIGVLLQITGTASRDPGTMMFLAILSALWIGGSSCIREVVDERSLIERDPHLPLLGYGAAKLLLASAMGAIDSAILTAFVASSGVTSLPLTALWAILVLTTISGSTLALILSALCDAPATALAWFPLLLVPQVVFGGFLFPYGQTRPFALDPTTGVVDMPSALVRPPVDGRVVNSAGMFCVSRWALEAYAAKAIEENLTDPEHLQEAIRVSFYVPLTLVDVAVTQRLREAAAARSGSGETAAGRVDARSPRYLQVLAAFALVHAVVFIVVLVVRDPRRV